MAAIAVCRTDQNFQKCVRPMAHGAGSLLPSVSDRCPVFTQFVHPVPLQGRWTLTAGLRNHLRGSTESAAPGGIDQPAHP